jgi:hypothetical protein
VLLVFINCAMSSPPEFIVTVSRHLGLDFEEIRQAKRSIESQALVLSDHLLCELFVIRDNIACFYFLCMCLLFLL